MTLVRTLYSDQELRGLRVEEIESEENGGKWLITLGWPEGEVRHIGPSSFGVSSGGIYAVPRVYKQFTIDAETGAMISMKDRNL